MGKWHRLLENRILARPRGTLQSESTLRKPVSLHLEQLEQRMLMDGAGFVHTDPTEDPDSIVGVAGIEARDDHRETHRGTIQLHINPLRNDQLPEGSDNLRIKSVSATRLGHSVTISDDGQRLIYKAGEGGLQQSDTFYYIVESNDGKLGKANVNLSLEREFHGGGIRPQRTSSDNFDVFEDSPERQLHVLRNDGEFRNGEIIAVTFKSSYYNGPLDEPPPSGSIRIAEDGKSLFYQPSMGFSGRDYYEYTVRNSRTAFIWISVRVATSRPFCFDRTAQPPSSRLLFPLMPPTMLAISAYRQTETK